VGSDAAGPGRAAGQIPWPARRIPDPALVVLAGASGAGKSAWAAAHYRAAEVVSSDGLRAVVGSGERDLDASADAFSLLDQIAAARTRRGLATVIDTLGLDPARRRGYLELARRAGLPAVAVLFELREHCARAGRDPAEVLVTVLDTPVVGTDRAHAADLVERLRGRTAAATFARRHHAGTPGDHIGRYRQLAERGVRTVFTALPDLSGPDEVLRLAPVLAAFS
jgi:predicted kinase